MPAFQAMAERANHIFNRENIGFIPVGAFEHASFATIAAALGIVKTDYEKSFLGSWPLSIQDAMTAAIRSAVVREPRLPGTISSCWCRRQRRWPEASEGSLYSSEPDIRPIRIPASKAPVWPTPRIVGCDRTLMGRRVDAEKREDVIQRKSSIAFPEVMSRAR
jgi:hypothetical protein